jgi:lipoate-protein ligase A
MRMRYFDRSFATPEEELACDEVLLDICEERTDGEVLRVWQPRCQFVVLGYTNEAAREANLAECAAEQIPVTRRTTGGGAIVQMPGCLNYALVMRRDSHPDLSGIGGTNRFMLTRLAAALSTVSREPVVPRGHTDLCVGMRKVAGNAQRRRARALLFHGTLLLHANIPEIERLLPFPSAQPGYRMNRPHREFLANLQVDPAAVTAALQTAWHAHTPYTTPFEERLATLAREKYGSREWTMRK